MWIGHRKEIRKLTFRALALCRSGGCDEEGTFTALKITNRYTNKLSSSQRTKTFTLQAELSGRMLEVNTLRKLRVALSFLLQTITLWTPETNELRKTLSLPYPDEEIK